MSVSSGWAGSEEEEHEGVLLYTCCGLRVLGWSRRQVSLLTMHEISEKSIQSPCSGQRDRSRWVAVVGGITDTSKQIPW